MTRKIDSKKLSKAIRILLQSYGLQRHKSQKVSKYLVDADLSGQSSHGVVRLPLYINKVEKKEINGTTYTFGRFVFLEYGLWEFYSDGEQKAGHTWSIKGEEVHMEYPGTSLVEIYIIEAGELKFIAAKVGENEREDIDESRQIVLTKEK